MASHLELSLHSKSWIKLNMHKVLQLVSDTVIVIETANKLSHAKHRWETKAENKYCLDIKWTCLGLQKCMIELLR